MSKRHSLFFFVLAASILAADLEGRVGFQLFDQVTIPGFSSIREGMNGVALADLNRDGLVDIVATYAEPELQGRTGRGTQLRVFLNNSQFRFRERQVTIQSRELQADRFGGQAQVPVLADFNRDGFLDLFITRGAPMLAGKLLPRARALGNTLLVSQGKWDVFADVSGAMGIGNEEAYNRQAAFGDVNRDGWLDIAVGADNIGNADHGLPYSRLYVFQPRGGRFEAGTFHDIGGSGAVPDFGGFAHDSSKDKAGPDITLADLDNDADLDLVQSYHVDCRQPGLPYSPCEYRQGVFVWRNVLADSRAFRFTPETSNGLAEVGQLKYDRARGVYDAVRVGAGLAYLSVGDVNNDGLADVVAVGPSDPGWSPRADDVGGRFWYNVGGMRFRRATEEAGLAPLNWSYVQWYEFFGLTAPKRRPAAQRGVMKAQPRLVRPDPFDNRPYYADAVLADFNNDGWLDMVIPDRRGQAGIEERTLLFMNRGDGTFEPVPTAISGLTSGAINAEVVDFDNDGMVDLLLAADPDNSGETRSLSQYESKIYRNTGAYGARENHWLRARFRGVSDAALVGARVEARVPGGGNSVATRIVASKQNYKSGSPLEAHFGLGPHQAVDVDVFLIDGKKVSFSNVRADRFVELDLGAGTLTPVQVK